MKLRVCTQLHTLQAKRVLYRVDYNVETDEKGRVHADERYRIEATIPTLRYLIRKRAKVIILSHRGRPHGKEDPNLSLKPVAITLGKLLGKPVKMIPLHEGEGARRHLDRMKPGQVVLLENLRFHPGEEVSDNTFAHDLASLGDVFINDAFGAIHRDSASMTGIPEFLPSYAGLLMDKEVSTLDKFIAKPTKPHFLIMGGAKAATKLPLIQKLMPKAERVLVGGVLANTILKSARQEVGASIYEKDFVTEGKVLARHKKVLLPTDCICDDTSTKKIESQLKDIESVLKKDAIVDLGMNTVLEYVSQLRKAKSVLWNGPLGMIEQRQGSHASEAIAEFIAARTHDGSMKSFIGGGETVRVFARLGLLDDVTFASTGGGALLSFISDRRQPGLLPLVK
ncbi:MAG: phosphoglycerate kinase [Patescibacteria group bacterium]